MKKAIYLVIMLFLINLVYAADFTYNVNQSELPYLDSELIILKGFDNVTMNVTYGGFTQGLDSVYFDVDSSSFTVDILISENTTSGNYTDIVSIYNLDLDFSYDILFDFIIINDSPSADVDYVQIDINEYEYTRCDYELPWNTTQSVTIAGRHGQIVQTDYNDKFFSVVDEIGIPVQNYSAVDIEIHLANLSIGDYTEAVKFSVVGDYNNVTFHFKIVDCVIPPPDINAYYEACFDKPRVNMTVDELLTCAREKKKYDDAWFIALLENAEDKIVQNKTIEYVNYTERVPVLDLYDPELIQTLKDIPVTWKQMITDSRQKESDIKSLRSEVDDLKSDLVANELTLNTKVKQSVSELMSRNTLLENTIDAKDEEQRGMVKWSKVLWSIIIAFVALGLFVGYYVYIESNIF